jgi:hypothetical protein
MPTYKGEIVLVRELRAASSLHKTTAGDTDIAMTLLHAIFIKIYEPLRKFESCKRKIGRVMYIMPKITRSSTPIAAAA